MLFNSISYLLFLPVVTGVYYLLSPRWRWVWVLITSYFFYACWNIKFILLLFFSTLLNFYFARWLETVTSRYRKKLLFTGIFINLSVLIIFKYLNFLSNNLDELFSYLRIDLTIPRADLILPIAISFDTFRMISYLVDVYQGGIKAERHIGYFALYVAFFPQLVAGPIERAEHFLPQMAKETSFNWQRISSGIQLALWGLFKKVVIADQLALYVDAVYGNLIDHNSTTYLIATYFFALQIYCDFSGYTDIARGSARILGYDLVGNFKFPYWSRDPTEFWRRWHISLSQWLRDYVYIPLGGNREGHLKTYRNLMLTMLLGGLWHGANWNYVVWGGLHGVFLSIYRWLKERERSWFPERFVKKIRSLLKSSELAEEKYNYGNFIYPILTFHLVCLGWIFFRVRHTSDALRLIKGLILGPYSMPFADHLVINALFGLLIYSVEASQIFLKISLENIRTWPTPIRWSIWYTLIYLIILFGVDGESQFIYFQF